MSIKRVFIDCGHGLNNLRPGKVDPGATSAFGKEAALALAVGRGVSASFHNSHPEVIVAPELSLRGVVEWLNKQYRPGDFVLSLHLNASENASATGCEVIYSHKASTRRIQQALTLASVVSKVLGVRNRGVVVDTDTPNGSKDDGSPGLAIVSDTVAPALLVELGFITNKNDVVRVLARGVTAVSEGIRALAGEA